MISSRNALAASIFLCASLAACGGGGGGGGGSTPSTGGAPTPTPVHGGLTVSPSFLEIDGTDTAARKTFQASESLYTGSFSETDTCAPSAGTIATIVGSGTFIVSGVNAGTCTVTVHDTNGQTADVTISVNTSSITVQSKPGDRK